MATSRSKQNQRPAADELTQNQHEQPNPVWFKPVMFGLMLLGLIWIVVYYISGSVGLPVPALGPWNILVGFGIAMIGFLMSTQWR